MRTNPHPSRAALAILLLELTGCVVGAARVDTPARLPSKTLPPLTRPISFDVCVSHNIEPPSGFEEERLADGDTVRNALSRAGVRAQLTSTAGSPVDFTLTRRGIEYDGIWSLVVSGLTLSLVPGYYVEWRTVDVNLAWPDAARVRKNEHLQYRSRMTVFVWLPLVVYPDIFAGINGGWVSSKEKDAGFERMVERLGDDIRTRLGRDRETTPPSEGVGVVCP
jgi:hypothetical protein